jgi:hypothetical protein
MKPWHEAHPVLTTSQYMFMDRSWLRLYLACKSAPTLGAIEVPRRLLTCTGDEEKTASTRSEQQTQGSAAARAICCVTVIGSRQNGRQQRRWGYPCRRFVALFLRCGGTWGSRERMLETCAGLAACQTCVTYSCRIHVAHSGGCGMLLCCSTLSCPGMVRTARPHWDAVLCTSA